MTDKKRFEIIPSLLSADFSDLASEIAQVEKAGCRSLHLDVMDGHFVPNITIGPVVAKSVRKVTKLNLIAHLMVEEPELFLEAFREAGVDGITIHREIAADYIEVLKQIKAAGLSAGVSIRPKTPVESIAEGLPYADHVLIMSVEPGFGGQEFIEGSEEKIAETRRLIESRNLPTTIEVDGGINAETAPRAAEAGATGLIAGNAVFGGDVGENIEKLRKSVE